MNSYRLTTPNMRGDEVKTIQKSLRSYYKGRLDGIFGEQTALAVKQAKFDLGYAEKDITSEYDQEFADYYSGKKKPTFFMKQRATSRAKKTLGESALIVGQQFVGVHENPPGSNKVMFSNWYGMTGPWCAMFVSYCFVQAKSKAFNKGSKYAYCPYIYDDAKYHRNNLTLIPVANVRVGDVVLFQWKHNGVADHVGIVTSPPSKDGTFNTIEGNTSGTNPSDGGMVANMTRNTKDVLGFVRVLA